MAGTTRRLLGDIFQLRDLGRGTRGESHQPVAAWVVEGVSAFDSRFEAIYVAGLTDFIGRQLEFNFLLARQRLAWKGEGQIALISGEPGSVVSPGSGSRRTRLRRAAHALALSMLAPTHQQPASSVHHPTGTSGAAQGGRYRRATPGQAGSGSRPGCVAGSRSGAPFSPRCCRSPTASATRRWR